MSVDTTTTGYIRLLRDDGTEISRHTQMLEAISKASKEPPGSYTLRQPDVKVVVTADATVPPAPQPPAPPPAPEPPPPPAPVPSFNWIKGLHLTTKPLVSKPAKGVLFNDPVYGVPMMRVTDHGPEAPNGFARNSYSRRDPFNADETLQLVYALDGFWHLYDAGTAAYVGVALGSGIGSDCEPHWDPVNPDVIRRFSNYGGDASIWETNVRTGVHTKAAQIISGYDNVWTKDEGSPSADHRYWALMCENAWDTKKVICFDFVEKRVIGELAMPSDPDHVSMSPCGNYVVISHYGNGWGVRAYKRDFSDYTQLDDAYGEHSDICLLEPGRSAYVSVEYQDPSGPVYYTPLDTGVRVPLFNSYPGEGNAFHFSGKCYGKPGWVLGSSYGGGSDQWFDNKVFLLHLPTKEILNVAFHQAGFGSEAYFFEPHAAISRSGRLGAFTSSWGGTRQADIEAYQLRFPAFG